MAEEMFVPIQTRGAKAWTRSRLALVDTGAANAVLPGARGAKGCSVAYADIAGERYWGETRFVDLRIPGTSCRSMVEAFVPLGLDPRPSTSWTNKMPRELFPVGRFQPIVGHRFLEATGATLHFGKNERLACDPANADPKVTAFVVAGPTMHFGVVCAARSNRADTPRAAVRRRPAA